MVCGRSSFHFFPVGECGGKGGPFGGKVGAKCVCNVRFVVKN